MAGPFVHRGRRLAPAFALCAALAITGCGGGSSVAAEKAATFVALANKFCREARANRALSAAQVARDAASARNAAHEVRNLPGLRRLAADLAAERRLRTETQRATTRGGTIIQRAKEGILRGASETLTRAYRLKLKVYNDERALGLAACARRPRTPIRG